MSDSRMNNGSKDQQLGASYREIITSKDVRKLIDRNLGTDTEIVNYTINRYSDENIGFLGSHQRLVITITDKSNENDFATSKIEYFVKAIPYDVETHAEYVREKGVFKQETYFFENVAPELGRGFNVEPWSPECYIIKNDCLVFEELSADGFKMRGKLLNETEIRSGLDAIARLHGASLHAETRLGRRLNEIYPDAFEERAFLHGGNQYRWYLAGIRVAERIAELKGLDSKNLSAACDHVFEAVKPSTSKQNVASHGDLWSNNLMFDESLPPRCRLVDFQLARYSPLGHDVAQFLYLCGSREFREQHDREMLRYYYQRLCEYINEFSTVDVELPSWNDLILSYEEQKLGAVVTAVIYFPSVLMDGTVCAKIMNDPDTYEKFTIHDRRDTVVDIMKHYPDYRWRLEETVKELVEMSQRLDQLPKPC